MKKNDEQIKQQVEYYFSLLNNASYFYIHFCSRQAQKQIQEIVRNEQERAESIAKGEAEQVKD